MLESFNKVIFSVAQELTQQHESQLHERDVELARLRHTLQDRDRDVTRANDLLQETDVTLEVFSTRCM